jgi:hypothetical protein
MAEPEFTESEKRLLRKLAESAYEVEVHRALALLDAEFVKWRNGGIDGADLLVAIHEFHQHESRDMWTMYQSTPGPLLVARGLARRLIAPDDVPPSLRDKLAPLIEAAGAVGRDLATGKKEAR